MKVREKAIVVTGGGSGIGRALVLELLTRGARVAAVDLRPETLAETVEIAGTGDQLISFVADVTDRDTIGALPGQVATAFGAVDGYISNAGIIHPFVRVHQLDFEDIERVINVNLFGALNMAKAFIPHLLERPDAHLANVSSMGAFLPVPGQTIYGAAKAGVKLLTEGLYTELLATNVGASVVMPGGVITNITTNSGIDIPMPESADQSSYTMTSAEDAARIIVDGIEADQLHILVGRDARFLNLASRVAPRRAAHLITRQMKDLLPD